MDENTTPDPTLEDSVQYLLQQVPAPVRTFVMNNLGPTTQELMATYQLHVDQGAVLERELLLMLVGQEQPSEFVTALQNANIPPETVQLITNDINEKVFMKLRSAEEKSPSAILPVAPEPVRAVPPPPAPAPISEFVPSPPPIPPVPAAPAPVPPPVSASIPPVQQFVPPAPQVVQPTDIHEVRTMASDINLVKSGAYQERQEAAFQPPIPPITPRTPTVTPPAPVIPPITPSVPPPPMPPQPQVAPPSAPKAPAPQSENREALHDILKQYGVDPYREPPE